MESPVPHNAVDGKVGGINRPVFLFDFQIPLVFPLSDNGWVDGVIVFHQRFFLETVSSEDMLIIFVGGSGLSINAPSDSQIVLVKPPDFEAARFYSPTVFFHLLKPPDFLIAHGNKIPHEFCG